MSMALNALRREVIKLVVRRTSTNRKLPSLAACDASFRQFHLSSSTCKDKKKQSENRRKPKAESQTKRHVTDEMKTAAKDVAQLLGGENWTKTADELLARLASHQEPPPASPTTKAAAAADEETTAQTKSLLNTMAVEKKFKGKRSSRPDYADGGGSTERPRQMMRQQAFKSIFGGARLGIFDAETVKAEVSKGDQAETDASDLWHLVDNENLRKQQESLYSNAFEEMAQWTREGKMWKFPVDNEEDMHEERQYKFYDHIFLDKYLGEFPDQGPIRKFMELVVIGLGSNPWLTVPEKLGHIQWYAEYFREKEDILVASLGEHGRMKAKASQSAEAQ